MLSRSLIAAVALLLLTLSGRAELVWTKPIQDFQSTPDQSSVEAHFAFRNSGKSTVTIKELHTSCGCTTAKLDKKIYAPGEGGEVTAVYKFPFQKGALRKLVTVVTDDKPKEQAQVLDIRVFVQEPFEIKPALVVWRTGSAADPKPVQLRAEGGAPVHVKSVTSSNPRLTATLSTVTDGEEYNLLVRPTDTAQRESGEISVVTDFPSESPKTYKIQVRIK